MTLWHTENTETDGSLANVTKDGPRRDVHRRGAFQPKFYRFVGWYYLGFTRSASGRFVASASVARCSDKLETFRRSKEAWDFGAIVYGDFGRCAVCGARFAMGEVWQHDETKDMIHIGHECADKYSLVSGVDWSALEDERRRKGLALKTAWENARAKERIEREHPEFIVAVNDTKLTEANFFIADVARKFERSPHDITERQIAAVIVSAAREHEIQARKALETAEREARNASLVHLGTVGERLTWTATLVFFTTYETAYGVTKVCKFKVEETYLTPNGAVTKNAILVWKATSTELSRLDVGKMFVLTGTIKAHDEYKGEKQTMISRCKVVAS